MTADEQKNPAGEPAEKREGLSWATMLVLVAVAIVVATGFAYLLVRPFFHQHAP